MLQRFNDQSVENKHSDKKAASRIFRYLTDDELLKVALTAKSWQQLIQIILRIRKQVSATYTQDERSVIADAFIQSFEIPARPTFTMTPIIGGCSPWSSTYKIQLDHHTLVLRKTSQQRELEGRFKETSMARQFSLHGITPKVHYTNPYDGIIIQAFIPSIPRWHYQLDAKQIEQLARKMRAIKHIKYQPMQDHGYDEVGMIVARKERLTAVLQMHPVFVLQQQSLTELQQLAAYLQHDTLAHNNLHLNNILFDGQEFWIIDLESVSKGDSSLDLAMLSASARLKPEIEKQLLNAYYEVEPDQAQQARYIIMKAMSYLLLSLSFFTNCQDYESLLPILTDPLPNFMAYDPKVDGVVDPNANQGKYSISIMLAKEALRILTSPEYRDAVQFLTDQKQPGNRNFWGNSVKQSAFVPDSFTHRVFNLLDHKTLQTSRKVSQQWRSLSRATFFSRDKKAMLPLEQCPAAIRARIENSLATRFSIDHDSPIEIRPLSGGLSPWANIYYIGFNQRKYVLRVLSPELSRQGKSREIATMQLFAERGVTPLIEHADLANGIILMKYIENNPRWIMPTTKSKLIEIARLLRIMHSIKFPNDANQFAVNHRMQEFEEKLRTLHAPNCLNEIINKTVETYSEILAILQSTLDFTLCHYDLNPWNLLHDGQRLWAIDWEFSQIGHPLFDLATIANFIRLSPEDNHFLLTCYLSRKITEVDKHTYYLMKQLSYLRYAMCSLALCENMDMKADSEIIAQLPPFQQFVPGKNPTFSIDKSTDEGRMMIAVMFAKEALQNLQSATYLEAMQSLGASQSSYQHSLKI